MKKKKHANQKSICILEVERKIKSNKKKIYIEGWK
jgi:hypothetical protein